MKNRIYQLFLRTPRLVLYGAAFALQLFFVSAQSTLAATTSGLPGLNATDIPSLITNVICQIAAYMFYILIALAVVFVLLAAYKYLTSSGEPEKVKSATKTITFAAVAIVVALLAYATPLVIVNTLSSSTYDASKYCTLLAL